MRMPDANKWNREALAAVRATPWDLHASKEPEVVFKPSGEDAEKPFEQQETLSRNLYLRADDFEKHGLTRGCPKSDQFLRRGDWKLTSGPHSSLCRTRITTELAKAVAGQIRIAKASGRMMKDVDRIVQASTDQPQGEKVDVVQDRPIADNVPPPFVALPGATPTTMAFVRYASIYQTTGTSANERIRLLQKDVSYMNEYWPNRTSTGQPRYYAMWDQNTIYLAPTPNLAYNIELALNRNETGLSATNTTTWVSTNAPQVLLYGCLIEAFKYLKGPYDLLAQYDKSYQQAVQGLQIEQQGRRRRDEYQDGVIRLPLPSQNP